MLILFPFRILLRRPWLSAAILLILLPTAIFLAVTSSLLFGTALPMRRAYHLEREYIRRLEADALSEELLQGIFPQGLFPNDAPEPRVQPLIQDVEQLHSWGSARSKRFDALLGLNFDGTGVDDCQGKEYWIYAGGTADEGKVLHPKADPTVFSHRYKKHSCKHPAYICNAYNAAFDRISARWHGITGTTPHSTKAILRYANCDISPQLCGRLWGLDVNPVTLVHLKIGNDCDHNRGIGRCHVTWRFYKLPIVKPAWTRQIRIPLDGGGSTVVPAFPDAEEQMWTLMSHPDANKGLHYNDHQSADKKAISIFPVKNGRTDDTGYFGLQVWGWLRSFVDNSWALEMWPKEQMMKCDIERRVDEFLKWWDGEPTVVYPRSCEGVEAMETVDLMIKDFWSGMEKMVHKLNNMEQELNKASEKRKNANKPTSYGKGRGRGRGHV